MLEKAFFCENCRVKIHQVDKIYYVEDFSDRGFCSEECIKEFYNPIMGLLEEEEKSFRSSLRVSEEDDYLALLSQEELVDDGVNNPDEVWLLVTEIEQRFFTHVKRFNQLGEELYLVLICSYIDNGPSFVFYRTITSSKLLVDKYRRTVEIELNQKTNITPDNIPVEVIELLDSKKSSLLANLLEVRSDTDISFELFMDYECYLQETMDSPDEVYCDQDEVGDDIFNFIKSFINEEEETFFYIVIAYPYRQDKQSEVLMLPILSFPSTDPSIYPEYSKGEKMNEKLNN